MRSTFRLTTTSVRRWFAIVVVLAIWGLAGVAHHPSLDSVLEDHPDLKRQAVLLLQTLPIRELPGLVEPVRLVEIPMEQLRHIVFLGCPQLVEMLCFQPRRTLLSTLQCFQKAAALLG